jgi:hypothetical protein
MKMMTMIKKIKKIKKMRMFLFEFGPSDRSAASDPLVAYFLPPSFAPLPKGERAPYLRTELS